MSELLHVLNTRPADRAAGLTRALQQAGHSVTELPLLQLDALPLDSTLAAQLAAIVQVQAVIVVSPTAAQLGLDYMLQLGLHPAQLALQWIAVGQGTAQVLKGAGLQALTPDIESSEGVLALQGVLDARLSPQVMVWRGVGGRELMLRQLGGQGHTLHNIVLYRRGMPAGAPAQYRQLLQHPPDVLLISSGESWRYWQQLGQDTHMPLRMRYILVLGQRVYDVVCADIARQSMPAKVVQLHSLRPDSILLALTGL